MRHVVLALAFVVLLSPRGARADARQPDGTQIPQGTALQDLFRARGEAIDAVRDAAMTPPERFVPGCRLTFTLVTRGPALFRNSFGWYNVTSSAPAESDLHVLIPCTASTGFVANLDLRSDPGYRGGEIGFFLRTPESHTAAGTCSGGDCCGRPGHMGRTYYTERRFNPDNVGASAYIHLLTYDSRATAQAFYFAWEDLFGGGDNQFTDFVALVGNIVCSGAGASCSTGRMGVCAAGTQQCRGGALACVGTGTESAERCDGLDNDCDGATDEGDGLCAAGEVCDRARCVPRCVEGGCFEGQRCTARGTCVETACATVDCPAGQRCEAGRCVGACDGVRCPGARTCCAGRCVDPCEGVTCDADQVCVAGVCEPLCQCRRCAAGLACQADGRCVPAACATVTCPAGQVCQAGACVDPCTGAVCPRGERCVAGGCVADAPDGGADAGRDAAGDVGFPAEAGGADAGPAGDAMDAAGDDGLGWSARRGCACRAAGRAGAGGAGGGAAWMAAALAAAMAGSALRARGRRGRGRSRGGRSRRT